MPDVPAPDAMLFCERLFSATGMPAADAATLARSVIDTNLAGHDSHGLVLVPRYVDELESGTVRKELELEIERETPNTARIHAHDSQGHVAARAITELAIERARRHGIAAITAHHLGHVGRLGSYVEMAAAADCIALATINNHGGAVWMHPFGGSDRRLSPNPLGIGAPTGGAHPLVLDMSGSAVAVGKCQVAKMLGRAIPLGWILDNSGTPCTDPAALLGPPPGALVPLGGDVAGHKGYALAFLMDVLAGALSGAGCSRTAEFTFRNGLFLCVVRIENFVELADFTGEVDRLIEWVKASPRSGPDAEILFPGEFEARSRERRATDGIPVPDELAATLRGLGERLGIEAGTLFG